MRGQASFLVALTMLAVACEPVNSGAGDETSPVPLTAERSDETVRAVDTGVADRGTFRGLLVWGDEVRAFTPCGDAEAAWVSDSTGALWKLYREMASRPYQPLYAELQGVRAPPPGDGFGSEYTWMLTVEHWLHLAVDTVDCVRKAGGATPAPGMEGLEYRAFGNEPFWSVSISPGEIAFQELGSGELLFPHAPSEQTGDVRIYRARTQTPAAHEIRIEIRKTDCSDTMADAVYGYAADVLLDGRAYRGCARRGGGEEAT